LLATLSDLLESNYSHRNQNHHVAQKTSKTELEITTPLTRHAVESLETLLDNMLKSDATTLSESTVKASHRNDEIGSGSIAGDGVEIGTDEGNMTTLDRDEMDISTSLAHLGVSHADNVDPESLARLGLFYIDTEDTDDEKVTNIAQWNCHEVSNGHFTSSKSHLKEEVYEMSMCSAAKSTKSRQKTHRLGQMYGAIIAQT
jgi:hypothetical protein